MAKLDPYSEPRLFMRLVELGSIRAVARELGVEPSSVSRRLGALEKRIGVALLHRGAGNAKPTAAGEQYYEKMRELIGQIDQLETDISGDIDRPRGLLRVTAAIDFGQHHIAPWMLDFKKENPGIEVELSLSSRNVDLVAAGLDVAIRVGQQADSSLIQTRLAGVPRVLVAAPDYLARRGTPKRPEDLADHDHIFFLPENRKAPLRLTGPDGATHTVMRSGGVTINAIYSIVQAVKQGFGVHVGPRWAFFDGLADGSVVELLPGYTTPTFPMFAVRAPLTYVPARTRTFIDFVRQRVREVPGLEP